MYFESHAHYDDKKFDEDRDELLLDLKNHNVGYVVNVGADMQSSHRSIKMAEKYDFVYASVGIHPHEAINVKEDDYKTLEKWLQHKKVVALGEIGLDFYYDFSPRDIQRQVFKKQLKICENVTKPVIIHSREASQEVFDIIKDSKVRKGVIHAYSGSLEMALEYIKLGFYIGVGGVLTFKNANKLLNVVENIPLEAILIETDSPYLSPVPVRGTRNNSQNLKYVVQKISEIKQIKEEIIEKITLETSKKFFCIK
ncbi:TatD family hydrolase [uncultured Tyzzerella sp.]|uniref:TatD family hydrolase n=1 Tax=uncultured Tyzzerella sp. TaxID=2321398 RepID=UPI00294395F6|nr:TatD family hydrolase [uncultured Tyzzerella sp.]